MRKKAPIGAVLQIKLGDNSYAHARALQGGVVAFYDKESKMPIDATKAISANVAFKVWVMDSAFKLKHWSIIGEIPLEPYLLQETKFYKQDAISKSFYIYDEHNDIPVTWEECSGLEKAAIWSAEHIEDRLRDYFAGVPNKWVESLKPKLS